jgi:NADP oxidoreductase coenzyme F420-dependent
MQIGTIEAGNFGQAFAKRGLKAGHNVKLSNSRGPDSLGDIFITLVDRLCLASAQCHYPTACAKLLLNLVLGQRLPPKKRQRLVK